MNMILETMTSKYISLVLDTSYQWTHSQKEKKKLSMAFIQLLSLAQLRFN